MGLHRRFVTEVRGLLTLLLVVGIMLFLCL